MTEENLTTTTLTVGNKSRLGVFIFFLENFGAKQRRSIPYVEEVLRPMPPTYHIFFSTTSTTKTTTITKTIEQPNEHQHK